MIQLYSEQRVVFDRLLGNSHKLFDPQRDDAAIEAYLGQCGEEFVAKFRHEFKDLRFGSKKQELDEEGWKKVRDLTSYVCIESYRASGFPQDV